MRRRPHGLGRDMLYILHHRRSYMFLLVEDGLHTRCILEQLVPQCSRRECCFGRWKIFHGPWCALGYVAASGFSKRITSRDYTRWAICSTVSARTGISWEKFEGNCCGLLDLDYRCAVNSIFIEGDEGTIILLHSYYTSHLSTQTGVFSQCANIVKTTLGSFTSRSWEDEKSHTASSLRMEMLLIVTVSLDVFSA